jgi:signal peptidase I
VAVGFVFAVKTWVVNPYRIPSASMEPTLHCAHSSPSDGCEARFSDRVLANRFIYRFRKSHRGEIVVFDTPARVRRLCGTGGTYVKRLIGLPGETVYEDERGFLWVDGKKLDEPYVRPARRDRDTEFRDETWNVARGGSSATTAASHATRAGGGACRART